MGRRGRRASDRRARAVLVPATALLLLVVSVAAIGGVLLGRVLDRSVPAVEDGWRAWRGVDEDDERYVADLVADVESWPGVDDVAEPPPIRRGLLDRVVRVPVVVTVAETLTDPDADSLGERICGATNAASVHGFDVSFRLERADVAVGVGCREVAQAAETTAALKETFVDPRGGASDG
ncbi:hypothetical protein ABRQ22_03205 [Cellulosimicrobium sp. ES-005]|uniref:Flp pilus-assembly TadG-like N-terminal domain-containing protein n=1 Tax=Cellulosimicrobium sp. ES-005 TaxID=3163031 RepID=A0AAU8G3R7_9MICO